MAKPIGEDEADNPRSAWEVRTKRLETRLVQNKSEFDAALEYALVAPDAEGDVLKRETLSVVLFIVFERHDDVSLLRLLSMVPITSVGRDYIEHAIVADYRGRTIDDFKMLFDAYDTATSPKIKESLAAAIRRGMHDHLPAWYVDAQFVEEAKWYFDFEKDNWKVNKDSSYWPGSGAFLEGKNRVPPPLFVPISGPDSVGPKTLK